MDIYTRTLTIFLEYSHFHNKPFIITSLILHSHKSLTNAQVRMEQSAIMIKMNKLINRNLGH